MYCMFLSVSFRVLCLYEFVYGYILVIFILCHILQNVDILDI